MSDSKTKSTFRFSTVMRWAWLSALLLALMIVVASQLTFRPRHPGSLPERGAAVGVLFAIGALLWVLEQKRRQLYGVVELAVAALIAWAALAAPALTIGHVVGIFGALLAFKDGFGNLADARQRAGKGSAHDGNIEW